MQSPTAASCSQHASWNNAAAEECSGLEAYIGYFLQLHLYRFTCLSYAAGLQDYAGRGTAIKVMFGSFF